MPTPRTSLRSLAALALCAALPLLSGCHGPCTLVGCESIATLTVRDASNAPVTSFSGVLRVNDRDVAFACPSAGSQLANCEEGTVRIRLSDSSFETRPTLSVKLAAQGEPTTRELVGLTWQENFPNGEECDTYPCLSATASVTLD